MTDDTVKLNDTYLEVYFGDRMVVDSGKTFAYLGTGVNMMNINQQA